MFTALKSILLPGGKLVKPGETVLPSMLKGRERQLAILIQEGALVRGEAEVSDLDVERGGRANQLPALPTERDPKTGEQVLSSKFRTQPGDQTKARQRLNQIKQAEKSRVQKQTSGATKQQLLTSEERVALLEQFEGQEMTADEMKALGLVS